MKMWNSIWLNFEFHFGYWYNGTLLIYHGQSVDLNSHRLTLFILIQSLTRSAIDTRLEILNLQRMQMTCFTFILIDIPFCEKSKNKCKGFMKFYYFTNEKYCISIKWIGKKVKNSFPLKDKKISSLQNISCIMLS